MICYSLQCKAGHGFDSWFQNAGAFGSLLAGRLIACPVCGSVEVEKSLMAPAVRPARKAVARAEASPAGGMPTPELTGGALSAPQSELEAALAALRRHIEENSDYVGMNFASEARRMHHGEAPERPIHGEARPDEARAMMEEGLPVAPLPFLPNRKVN
jgi:hypothetical protein